MIICHGEQDITGKVDTIAREVVGPGVNWCLLETGQNQPAGWYEKQSPRCGRHFRKDGLTLRDVGAVECSERYDHTCKGDDLSERK